MVYAAEDNNNARYETGSQPVSISGLAYTEHSLKIWYSVTGITNATEETGYTATFTVSPATGIADIASEEVLSVEIYNVSGQIISRTKTLPAGIYIVKAKTATGTKTTKIKI
jgi:hypothetical protein